MCRWGRAAIGAADIVEWNDRPVRGPPLDRKYRSAVDLSPAVSKWPRATGRDHCRTLAHGRRMTAGYGLFLPLQKLLLHSCGRRIYYVHYREEPGRRARVAG